MCQPMSSTKCQGAVLLGSLLQQQQSLFGLLGGRSEFGGAGARDGKGEGSLDG